MAQSRGEAATAVDEPAGTAIRADARDPAPRSAFGRVMGIMIEALRRQASGDSASQASGPPVRTTAAGAPLGIEVGSAFRLDADNTPKHRPRRQGAEPATGALSPPLAAQDLP